MLDDGGGDDDDNEGGIGFERDESLPRQPRSMLRQQLERGAASPTAVILDNSEDRDGPKSTLERSSSFKSSDPSDNARYLTSVYSSSDRGIYGSLSSQVNESVIRRGHLSDDRQVGNGAEPDKEQEPLIVKRVEQEDGTIVHQILGQSTLPMTVLNSVNVLIGIGALSLPLAIKYSGWIIGMILLLFAALATKYTARLIARCLDRHPHCQSFSDLAAEAFGQKARLLVEALVYLELSAACVALIILFADSLNALIPGWNVQQYKILCGVIVIPLTFFPLRYLGITSILGIFCSTGSKSTDAFTQQYDIYKFQSLF